MQAPAACSIERLRILRGSQGVGRALHALEQTVAARENEWRPGQGRDGQHDVGAVRRIYGVETELFSIGLACCILMRTHLLFCRVSTFLQVRLCAAKPLQIPAYEAIQCHLRAVCMGRQPPHNGVVACTVSCSFIGVTFLRPC